MENRFQKIIDKIKSGDKYLFSDEFKKFGFEKNNTFEYKLYDVFGEWITGCILNYSYPPGHKNAGIVETAVGCVWNIITGDCIIGAEEGPDPRFKLTKTFQYISGYGISLEDIEYLADVYEVVMVYMEEFDYAIDINKLSFKNVMNVFKQSMEKFRCLKIEYIIEQL